MLERINENAKGFFIMVPPKSDMSKRLVSIMQHGFNHEIKPWKVEDPLSSTVKAVIVDGDDRVSKKREFDEMIKTRQNWDCIVLTYSGLKAAESSGVYHQSRREGWNTEGRGDGWIQNLQHLISVCNDTNDQKCDARGFIITAKREVVDQLVESFRDKVGNDFHEMEFDKDNKIKNKY